jgi:hypothetical protein
VRGKRASPEQGEFVDDFAITLSHAAPRHA